MTTITNNSPIFLRGVTHIARSVAHGHRGSHRSRTSGHVGTGNTLLVAPMVQRGRGKHRSVRAA